MQTQFMVRDVERQDLDGDIRVKFIKKIKEGKGYKPEIFTWSNFKAKNGEFHLQGRTLYVGTNGIKDADGWRTLGFKVGKKIVSLKVSGASIILPLGSQEFMQGIMLGTNSNNMYKSKPTKNKLEEVTFLAENLDDLHDLYHELHETADILDAQTVTQGLVDMTGQDATSETILEHIQDLFVHNEGSRVEVELYDEDYLESKNMEGHLAVNRASVNPAMTIKLTYIPDNLYDGCKSKNLVFVGKGLTYDTGGLSIKPTGSMTTMQCDKAGAMTLIGLMDYLSTAGGDNKVTCYIALAENSLGSDSYRPGDVLTMKNGKTVMIKNTDAEGRLVLFDNICLAQEQNKKIDALYSIATLTGSAVAQFGQEAAGLVGFNDKMKKKLIKCGNKQGEIFLDAPFHKFMLNGVDDTIADLSNTGTPYQGCQKAGLFLTHALKKKNKNKFLHIDIAGPAYTDKGFGSYKAGASGFGVRTLIQLCR